MAVSKDARHEGRRPRRTLPGRIGRARSRPAPACTRAAIALPSALPPERRTPYAGDAKFTGARGPGGCGEVPEWSNGAVSKTVVRFAYRGFESDGWQVSKTCPAFAEAAIAPDHEGLKLGPRQFALSVGLVGLEDAEQELAQFACRPGPARPADSRPARPPGVVGAALRKPANQRGKHAWPTARWRAGMRNQGYPAILMV